MDYSWLCPDVEVRPVGRHGWGSFVVRPIAAGTTVAAFGGWAMPGGEFTELPAEQQSRSIQIDDDLFLVGPAQREPGDCVNHSCEPSCGLFGATLLVAMRDLECGKEITFDYAMSDGTDYDEFVCACGARACRGLVTGQDWRDPELQTRYNGWFSPYLARRIAALRDELAGELACELA